LSGFGISDFQNRWTVKLRGCLGSPALQTVKIVKSFSVHHRCSAGQKAKPTKGENEALWLAARIDDGQITNLAVSEIISPSITNSAPLISDLFGQLK
jgi:hypothetical protein